MGLEHPAALALLPLILLLLFTRRRRAQRRVPVANLYLWNEAAPSDATALARRLRRHWLVIVQAAFLAAVALAIAQPIVASHPRTVAVILDRSISMGARQDSATRFDLAKADALSVVQQLRGNTRVRLITADADPHVIGEFDASDRAIAGALEALGPTDGPADLPAALDHARAADVPPQRLFVFTDADAPQPASPSADVEWRKVGRPADNVAITGLSTRRLPMNRTQVLVSMSNHGTAAVTADVTLSRERSELARETVTLPPGSDLASSFTVDEASGVLTATLEHDDALAADNLRRLALSGASTISVLVSARNDSFLQKALSVYRGVRIVESESEPHEVVVCDGCAELPNDGAAVLLIPPRSTVPQMPVALASVATDHRLADGLHLDGTSGITLAHRPLPEGSTVIAQGGGMPALAAYEAGGRRIVELRIDPDQGPFPYSSAFPVLVAGAVEWLANVDANSLTVSAGEPLLWQLPGQRRRPVVTGPDGEPVESSFNDGTLSVDGTDTAGIYRVALDSGDRTVAVNPAVRGESDLTAASGPAGVDTRSRGGDPAVSRDVTTIVVLIALLLLAAEWRYRVAGRLA